MKRKILLIEDEIHLQKIILLNLELENFQVKCLSKAPNILDILNHEYFDLILLDIMLPEVDGISICEKIKLTKPHSKIILMSAKSRSADRVLGIQKGADDYIVKPFEFVELLFRINKLLPQDAAFNPSQNILVPFGENEINFETHQATNYKKEKILLTEKENALLKLLIDNKNKIVSREKIYIAVWDYDIYPNTRTIDNFILKFRKYFEVQPHHPKFFKSIRGIGYQFYLE